MVFTISSFGHNELCLISSKWEVPKNYFTTLISLHRTKTLNFPPKPWFLGFLVRLSSEIIKENIL